MITFQGKSKWSHLDRPDTKFSVEGKWTQQIYLNDESKTKFLELKKEGLRNTLRQDDEGYSVVWSRPSQKMMKGRLLAFTPPKIEDKDGNTLPQSTRIGHGSDITVTVEVYYFTTPQKTEGCAARLAAVRIDNLVPFSRDDYDPKELRASKALDKTAPETW